MWLSKIRADSVDRSAYGSFWFEPVGRLSGSGARVTAVTSMALPAVFACVRVLAESMAILPFRLLRPSADGKTSERITDHWLVRLFTLAPNRFQSPFEFIEMLEGHLALRGNAFCQITLDGRGGIAELLPLHPDRMKMEFLPNGAYRYAYNLPGGQVVRYAPSEIWHLRGLSGDGYMGMSPVEVSREAVGQGLAMQDYASRLFANDARPAGGWIEFPGKFADAAAKQVFRDSWMRLQGGSNKGKMAVLDQGMKYHEVGLNNKDSQFIEARGMNRSDIASIFRIPPHKIGDLSNATFSNIEQQAIEFWQDTMMPWTCRWESSIRSQLLGAEDADLVPDFDMRRLMRADSTARGLYYQSGIQSGWLLRSDARAEEGLEWVEGLDKPLMPLNMATIDADGETEPLPASPNAAPPGADPEDAPPAKGPPAPSKKTPAKADRLGLMLLANAQRLGRRATKQLADGKVPAEVFDATFAALVAESLAVDPAAAEDFCLGMAARGAGSEHELVDALVSLGSQA